VISDRFARFLAVGGFAAGVNFGSRIVLDMAMPYVAAIVLAYCIGMATAFVLNRRFVFTGTDTPVVRQAGWFVLVNLAAVAQTLVVSLLLARWGLPAIGWDWQVETVAHAFGVAVPVVTSYFGHKWLSFAPGKSA
jgi:putative flippase GtrA